jgi:hypothetical protein
MGYRARRPGEKPFWRTGSNRGQPSVDDIERETERLVQSRSGDLVETAKRLEISTLQVLSHRLSEMNGCPTESVRHPSLEPVLLQGIRRLLLSRLTWRFLVFVMIRSFLSDSSSHDPPSG